MGMTAARVLTQTNQGPSLPLDKFDDSIRRHPIIASVGAVAFAVLGITTIPLGVLFLPVMTVPLGILLGLATGLSIVSSAYIGSTLLQNHLKNRRNHANVTGQVTGRLDRAIDTSRQSIDISEQTRHRGVQVMNETLGHLRAGFYTSPDGTRHNLDLRRAAQGASLLLSAGPFHQRPGIEPTRFIVKNQDCLYAAEEMNQRGLNPIVLDMASDGHFGGGYLTGARAQEEDCCRRTGLSVAVDRQHRLQQHNFYPLSIHSPSAGVYVPHVPVFRAGADRRYQYLNRPFQVAFGIFAALNQPLLNASSGRLRLRPAEATITREKIRTFFEMALLQGHDSVVYGAFGCGAFGNPPDQIAEMVIDVVRNEFAHCFKEITVAVLDDHNAWRAHNPEGNFIPFARSALAAGGTVINGRSSINADSSI